MPLRTQRKYTQNGVEPSASAVRSLFTSLALRRGRDRTLQDKSTLIFQHRHRVRMARVYIETIDARRGDRQKLRGTPVFGCASSTSLEIEICTKSPYSIWAAIHIAIAVRSSSRIFDYTLVSFRCSNAKSFISIYDSCFPPPRSVDVLSSSSDVVVLHFSVAIMHNFHFILFHYSAQRDRKLQDDECVPGKENDESTVSIVFARAVIKIR